MDLDGVLCDFEAGVQLLLGKKPDEVEAREMWTTLASAPAFYASLPWMPNGKELWQALDVYKPAILTGVPNGAWASLQKREWCAKELGENTQVITCKSKDKHLYVNPQIEEVRMGPLPHIEEGVRKESVGGEVEGGGKKEESQCKILIDDSIKLKEAWEREGGVFIHYCDTEGMSMVQQVVSRIEIECDGEALGGAQDVEEARENELRAGFLKRLHDQ